ncbi:MAG: hypothetical protein ABI833_13075 [Acidobacteriota bacterium]
MRGLSVALLIVGASLHAQQAMPVGILRGNLVVSQDGSLSVLRADGAVYDCTYDKLTFFQRNHWPIQSTELTAGEPVEVLSDRNPHTSACYVRMLSIVYAPAKSPRRRAPSSAPPPAPWAPHPYLSYSGLVIQSEPSSITLKTRSGTRTLRLRAGTTYSEANVPLVNKHVFVRAGRTLDGTLEAYQVMWGEILSAP